MRRTPMFAVVLLLAGAACTTKVAIDEVPVGTEVEVTRQDGGVVRGELEARDEQTVRVKAGRVTREVPREQIAVLQVVDEAKPAPLPPIARFREYTVPEGTRLSVRLETTVASDVSRVEDPVEATLTDAVVVDETTVIPAGSRVLGEVTAAEASGKVKGLASLAIRFHTVVVAGDDRYPLAARVSQTASPTKAEDAKKIGIPAAGGAIVGGIVGGRKGAVIGGAIGGGAGTAVVLSTAGDEVRFERGTVLTLPIERAIEVRVPIDRTSR